MALILGVKVGSKIYVGDTPIVVTESKERGRKVSVSVQGGKDIVLSEQESVEVMPTVFMSVGTSKKQVSGAENMVPRLVIEAPRSVVILRSELYEREWT